MQSLPFYERQFERVSSNAQRVKESATELVRALRLARTLRQPAMLPRAPALSARELAILRLIAEGLRNEEIAERLHFGHGTIKLHVREILEKFETSSRTVAAVSAVRLGII
jgi:DNA-binding NarL/FixJ family response regulator